jgi:hypothetical protein
LYANECQNNLMSGLDNNKTPNLPKIYSHTINLCDETMAAVKQYAGGTNMLFCPGFGHGKRIWTYNPKYGFIIGYNYLGGHKFLTTNSPAYVEWQSPQRCTDDPMLPLMVDANHWDTVDNWAMIPHAACGQVKGESGGSFVWGNGIVAWRAKAVGGNVGLLDGSVHWRNRRSITNRIASSHGDRYIGAW